MPELVLKPLRWLLLALQDRSTIDNDVMLIGCVINPYGAEGEMTKLHLNLCGAQEDLSHAHFWGVKNEKADHTSSTSWLPQCGHVISSSAAQSTRANILENAFLQERQKNS